MLLYLLRHAEASDRAASDAERALTEKGEAQARRVGEFCERNGLAPALILASPLRRAEQTARLAAEEIKGGKVEVAAFLASGMAPEDGTSALADHAKLPSVMIVGHEPDFSLLVAFLIGLKSSEHLHIRKASLTALEVGTFARGGSVLEWSLPAGLM